MLANFTTDEEQSKSVGDDEQFKSLTNGEADDQSNSIVLIDVTTDTTTVDGQSNLLSNVNNNNISPY